MPKRQYAIQIISINICCNDYKLWLRHIFFMKYKKLKIPQIFFPILLLMHLLHSSFFQKFYFQFLHPWNIDVIQCLQVSLDIGVMCAPITGHRKMVIDTHCSEKCILGSEQGQWRHTGGVRMILKSICTKTGK